MSAFPMTGVGVRVKILKNAIEAGEPKLVIVPDNLPALLKAAGSKLGLNKPKYIYTSTGALVDDINLLKDDEELFISEVEGFFKTKLSENSGYKTYKVAVLGPGGVGKSCITIRYTQSKFIESYDPTIENAFMHQPNVDGIVCMLEILDTAGQEDFLCLSQTWVENRDGFLLVYNMADDQTFNDVTQFYKLIEKEYDQKQLTRPPIVLVANKSDLKQYRKVSKEEGVILAQSWNGDYVETSAKTNTNIDVAFAALIRLVRKANSAAVLKLKTDPSSHDLALSLDRSAIFENEERDPWDELAKNKKLTSCIGYKCIIA